MFKMAASLEVEIARRMRAERKLETQEELFQDLLDTISEGIHQVDGKGKIMWANRAELNLLGYESKEYVGHNVREFHFDVDAVEAIFKKLHGREDLRDHEARLRHKDGSHRNILLNTKTCWQKGRFKFARCFSRDVTQLRRAVEAVDQQVAERTRDLYEKVAELEIFAFSISHDMRAPLRAMQGYADSLLNEHAAGLSREGRESAQRIERAANRLDKLITDILAYSKVSKEDIQLTAVELQPLLEKLISENPAIQKFSSNITIDKPLHAVAGNEAYLAQCFSNLISNALKFVRRGAKPRVRISTEMVAGRVCVSVQDNGIGIAPEHYGRIFQVFGRVYSEKAYPGTGIGLAVVKKAVTRMGGETGFQSTPGLGSRFWFTLGPASESKAASN